MPCYMCREDPNMPADLYGIHISIRRPDNIDKFREFCIRWLKVRPIVIDSVGDSLDPQVMTFSRFRADNPMLAISEANSKAAALKFTGYDVVRIKITTTLNNPTVADVRDEMYYESHIVLPDDKTVRDPVATADLLDEHISSDMSKEDQFMRIIRSYGPDKRSHQLIVENYIKYLKTLNVEIPKVIHKCCIYDKGWVKND